MGVLHGFDRVFRRKPSHYQGQLTIRCGLDGEPVNAQYILRSVSTTAVHFHNKLDVFHDSFQMVRFSVCLVGANTDLGRLELGVGRSPADGTIHSSVSSSLERRQLAERPIKEGM